MQTAHVPGQSAVQSAVQSTGRRVRHDVADAVRLAAFSLTASAAVALALSAFAHWVGAA